MNGLFSLRFWWSPWKCSKQFAPFNFLSLLISMLRNIFLLLFVEDKNAIIKVQCICRGSKRKISSNLMGVASIKWMCLSLLITGEISFDSGFNYTPRDLLGQWCPELKMGLFYPSVGFYLGIANWRRAMWRSDLDHFEGAQVAQQISSSICSFYFQTVTSKTLLTLRTNLSKA